MTFKQYISLEEILSADVKRRAMLQEKPADISGYKLPSDLSGLTLGDIATIQKANPVEILNVVTKAPIGDILKERAEKALGALVWVAGEVQNIIKLFNEASVVPTEEEKQAAFGIKNFGLFGIADWYAIRMGMESHEEALNTQWTRILICKQMDAEGEKYRRNLRQIHLKK